MMDLLHNVLAWKGSVYCNGQTSLHVRSPICVRAIVDKGRGCQPDGQATMHATWGRRLALQARRHKVEMRSSRLTAAMRRMRLAAEVCMMDNASVTAKDSVQMRAAQATTAGSQNQPTKEWG